MLTMAQHFPFYLVSEEYPVHFKVSSTPQQHILNGSDYYQLSAWSTLWDACSRLDVVTMRHASAYSCSSSLPIILLPTAQHYVNSRNR